MSQSLRESKSSNFKQFFQMVPEAYHYHLNTFIRAEYPELADAEVVELDREHKMCLSITLPKEHYYGRMNINMHEYYFMTHHGALTRTHSTQKMNSSVKALLTKYLQDELTSAFTPKNLQDIESFAKFLKLDAGAKAQLLEKFNAQFSSKPSSSQILSQTPDAQKAKAEQDPAAPKQEVKEAKLVELRGFGEANSRVDKGAIAPCPPNQNQNQNNGGHATLCPPYEGDGYQQEVIKQDPILTPKATAQKEIKSAQAVSDVKTQNFIEGILAQVTPIYEQTREMIEEKGRFAAGYLHHTSYQAEAKKIREYEPKIIALGKAIIESAATLSKKPLSTNFSEFTQEVEAVRKLLGDLKKLKEVTMSYKEVVDGLMDLQTNRGRKTGKQLQVELLETITKAIDEQIYCCEKFSSRLLVSLLNMKTLDVSDFRKMYSQHIERVHKLCEVYKEMGNLYVKVEEEATQNVSNLYKKYSYESVKPIEKEFKERVAALKQAVDVFSPESFYGREELLRKVDELQSLSLKYEKYYWTEQGFRYEKVIIDVSCLRKLKDKIQSENITCLWKPPFLPARTSEQRQALGENLLQLYRKAKTEAKTRFAPYQFLIDHMRNPLNLVTADDTLMGLALIVEKGLLSKENSSPDEVSKAVGAYLEVYELFCQCYEIGQKGDFYFKATTEANRVLTLVNLLISQHRSELVSQKEMIKFFDENQARIIDIQSNMFRAEHNATLDKITAPMPSIPGVVFMYSRETFLRAMTDPNRVSSHLKEAAQAFKKLIPIIMFYRDTFRVNCQSDYVSFNNNLTEMHSLIGQCLFSWEVYSRLVKQPVAGTEQPKINFKKINDLTSKYTDFEKKAQEIYRTVERLPNHSSYKEKEIYNRLKSSFQNLLLKIWNLPNDHAQISKEIEIVRSYAKKLVDETRPVIVFFGNNEFSDHVKNDVYDHLGVLKKELDLLDLSEIVPVKPEEKTERVVESKAEISSATFYVPALQAQNAWVAYQHVDDEHKPKCLEEILAHVAELQKQAGRIDMLDPELLAFLEKRKQEEFVRGIRESVGNVAHYLVKCEQVLKDKKLDLNNLPKDFIRPTDILSALSLDSRFAEEVGVYDQPLRVSAVRFLGLEMEKLLSEKEDQESLDKFEEAFETQKSLVKTEKAIEQIFLEMGLHPANPEDLLWLRETLAKTYLRYKEFVREKKQEISKEIQKSKYCQTIDKLAGELREEKDVIEKIEELEKLNMDKIRWSMNQPILDEKASNYLNQVLENNHSLYVDLTSPFALFPSDLVVLAESKDIKLSVATKDKAYVAEAENYRFKHEQYLQKKETNPAFDQRIADKYRDAMIRALKSVQDITLLSSEFQEKLKQAVGEADYSRRNMHALKVSSKPEDLSLEELYKLSMTEKDGVLAWKYLWGAIKKTMKKSGLIMPEKYMDIIRTRAGRYLNDIKWRLLPASKNAPEWRVGEATYDGLRPATMLKELVDAKGNPVVKLEKVVEDDDNCLDLKCITGVELIDMLRVFEARLLSLEIEALSVEIKAKEASEDAEDIKRVIHNTQEIIRKEKAIKQLLMLVTAELPHEDRLWMGTILADQLKLDMNIPVYIQARKNLLIAELSISQNQFWGKNKATERLKKLENDVNTLPKLKKLKDLIKDLINDLKTGKLKERLDGFKTMLGDREKVIQHVNTLNAFSPVDIVNLAELVGDGELLNESEEFQRAKKFAQELDDALKACGHWYDWFQAKDGVEKEKHEEAWATALNKVRNKTLRSKLEALKAGVRAPHESKATYSVVTKKHTLPPKPEKVFQDDFDLDPWGDDEVPVSGDAKHELSVDPVPQGEASSSTTSEMPQPAPGEGVIGALLRLKRGDGQTSSSSSSRQPEPSVQTPAPVVEGGFSVN